MRAIAAESRRLFVLQDEVTAQVVDRSTYSLQTHPSITWFSNGSLFVSYATQNGNESDIVARRVDPAGNVVPWIIAAAVQRDRRSGPPTWQPW
jgi:hypothetical protein